MSYMLHARRKSRSAGQGRSVSSSTGLLTSFKTPPMRGIYECYQFGNIWSSLIALDPRISGARRARSHHCARTGVTARERWEYSEEVDSSVCLLAEIDRATQLLRAALLRKAAEVPPMTCRMRQMRTRNASVVDDCLARLLRSEDAST